VTDTAWVEKKTREVREEHDRLEHELKSYKNNLIKESIRVSAGAE
jgi:COP9 signalosome complex subunit 1